MIVLLQKVSDLCHAPSLQVSNQTKNGVLLPRFVLELSNPHFLVLIEFRSIYIALWVMDYFSP